MGVLQQTTRPTESVVATGRLVAAGIVLGLAWGGSLRAWMTLLAIGFGDAPGYSWNGTFGGVILPAGIIGGVSSAGRNMRAGQGAGDTGGTRL